MANAEYSLYEYLGPFQPFKFFKLDGLSIQINEDWLMLKGCVIGCKKRCITLRKSLMSHSRRIHLEVGGEALKCSGDMFYGFDEVTEISLIFVDNLK